MDVLPGREGEAAAGGMATCPFVGARPFEGQDKPFFFGRDREARDLANMVAACTLTVVYGPSGAGKSSLLNTRLADELDAIEPDWIVVSFSSWRPGFETSLMSAIAAALAASGAAAGVASGAEPTLPLLGQHLLAAARASGRPIVLMLDQFEEYFLYNGSGATDFEAALARLANRRSGPVRVLLSLRSDRLFLLDRLRSRVPEILQNLFLVDPLDEDGARDAILNPVAAFNRQSGTAIRVEEELANAVVRGADEREIFQRLHPQGRGFARPGCAGAQHPWGMRPRLRIVAPFLQMALEALWRRDIDALGGTTLTLATLRALAMASDDAAPATLVGQLAQQHLDSLLSQRSEAEQAVCARLFDRMVTYAGGKVAVAVPADFQATFDAQDLAIAAALLAALAEPGPSRLVRRVATENPSLDAAEHFEIVHDALAVPILDWVARWRDRAGRAEAARRQQAAAAQELAKAQAGEALERAQREAAEARGAAERQRHLAAEAAGRRRSRIWRWGTLAFLAALGIGWGYQQYQARKDAILRFNAFAEKDSAPEFRLRLLLAIASIDAAAGPFWGPVFAQTAGDELHRADRILRDTLLASPRYGGAFPAIGADDAGLRLVWLTDDQQLVGLALGGARETLATPAQLRPLLRPSRRSRLEQLAAFPVTLTGFVGNPEVPVILRSGILFFPSRSGGSVWTSLDLADLLPDGFANAPGMIRPDITAGAVQLTPLDSVSDMQVLRLRPVQTVRGEVVFRRAGSMPATIRWRGQRFAPVLSPWLPAAPQDRYAYLDPGSPALSEAQLTRLTLLQGDLSTPGVDRVVWQGAPELSRERAQQGFDTAGASAQPAIAFTDDAGGLVVRVGPNIDLIALPSGAASDPPGLPPALLVRAPPEYGNVVTPGIWGGRQLIAAARVGTPGAGGAGWRIAWLVPGGVALLEAAADRTGIVHILRTRVLRTGPDTVYRLNFSRDARFLIAAAMSSPALSGKRLQQARVWDLDASRAGAIASATPAQLVAIACETAAIERPAGQLFSDDEKLTWIGPGGTQPCGSRN